MIQIFALVCCVSSGMFAGIFLRKRAIRKNEFFADLMRYISALQLNVSGRQQELGAFNEDFAKNCSETFREALLNRSYPNVSRIQKQNLDAFFSNLDTPGGSALLQHLEFFKKLFDNDCDEAAASAKKSFVYVKLGILFGAMVGILFL